jgi:hypothetical protein
MNRLNDKEVYSSFLELERLQPDEKNYVDLLYRLAEGINVLSQELIKRVQGGNNDNRYVASFIQGLIQLETKARNILNEHRTIRYRGGALNLEDIYNGFDTQIKFLSDLYNRIKNGETPRDFYSIIQGSAEYSDSLIKRLSRVKEYQGHRTTVAISLIVSLGFLSYLIFNQQKTAMVAAPGFSTASIFVSILLLVLSVFLLINPKLFKKQ